MLLKLIFGWVGFAVCFFCDLNFFIQIALICSLFTIYSPLVFEEALYVFERNKITWRDIEIGFLLAGAVPPIII